MTIDFTILLPLGIHLTTYFSNINEGNLKTIEPYGLKQWKHNSQ
jgi:hypothetical protein